MGAIASKRAESTMSDAMVGIMSGEADDDDCTSDVLGVGTGGRATTTGDVVGDFGGFGMTTEGRVECFFAWPCSAFWQVNDAAHFVQE